MTGNGRFDLHTHSRFSPDSRVPVQTLLDQCSFAGLRGVALTDHNTIEGHRRLRDLAAAYPRLILIPGIEVSTTDGHLLVYGARELPPVGQPLEITLDWSRERGLPAALAHPFRFPHGVGRQLAETANVAALESANGHSSELANARADLVAARRSIGTTGGSDAHDAQSIGRSYTEFSDELNSVDEVLDRLRSGRCRGTGRSLTSWERLSIPLRSAIGRMARGFRPI